MKLQIVQKYKESSSTDICGP